MSERTNWFIVWIGLVIAFCPVALFVCEAFKRPWGWDHLVMPVGLATSFTLGAAMSSRPDQRAGNRPPSKVELKPVQWGKALGSWAFVVGLVAVVRLFQGDPFGPRLALYSGLVPICLVASRLAMRLADFCPEPISPAKPGAAAHAAGPPDVWDREIDGP